MRETGYGLMPEIVRRLPSILRGWITPNLQTFLSSREPQLWLISVIIGLSVSVAAILFRLLILNTQWLWLGVAEETVAEEPAEAEEATEEATEEADTKAEKEDSKEENDEEKKG